MWYSSSWNIGMEKLRPCWMPLTNSDVALLIPYSLFPWHLWLNRISGTWSIKPAVTLWNFMSITILRCQQRCLEPVGRRPTSWESRWDKCRTSMNNTHTHILVSCTPLSACISQWTSAPCKCFDGFKAFKTQPVAFCVSHNFARFGVMCHSLLGVLEPKSGTRNGCCWRTQKMSQNMRSHGLLARDDRYQLLLKHAEISSWINKRPSVRVLLDVTQGPHILK